MMSLMPEIQSLGLPPERHADRVVLEMLKVIAGARRQVWPRLLGVIGRCPDGNPKAQARMLAKLEAAAGPFIVWTALESGKRGRYRLFLVTTDVWNPETKEIMAPDDAIPEMPWLAFTVVKLTSKGDHHYGDEAFVPLLVTHHALSRLAQRCGARTILDIWFAASEIGEAYFSNGLKGFSDNSRLKVSLPNEMGNAICVLRSDSDGADVVTTLWQEDEAPDEYLMPGVDLSETAQAAP
jgi:hypothetical protein